MVREKQQAGPVPAARFPRPAPPVRFRPSLPGLFDPGDEFVGPPNRLVNILEHGQALCEGGVHLIPSLSLGNDRRPGLRPPVGEKPPAGGPRSRKVNLGSGVDQLEVDEVAGPIARAGDGVELLGDLNLNLNLHINVRALSPESLVIFAKKNMSSEIAA